MDDKEKAPIDLKAGVPFDSLREATPLAGTVDGEAAILVRRGKEAFAVGATCTHYGGPLAEGLVVGETIRCPWHHACFHLRTGEVERAPALSPLPCFAVERDGDLVRVTGKRESAKPGVRRQGPGAVVIVGAGAAGAACADMLRAQGYSGSLNLVGDEEPGPVDRPNLSKDYLAGTAPEEWIPLRTREYYETIHVDFHLGDPAVALDTEARKVKLRSSKQLSYEALLLATGAEARSLPVDGVARPHVRTLRTLADSRAIIEGAARAKQCVVIGASFIGLEVAAALRRRGLDVAVVGPEAIPLARILGPELGSFVQKLHEKNGVKFHLGQQLRAIREDRVELGDGQSLDAQLVVLGVGVVPRTKLAEAAGLKVNNGIVVDERLRTSAAGVYAAGDVARYPDPISGELARIEHWAVAERQGQAVARAMLGIGGPYRDAPFFWSQHYDVTISYVGYAPAWDGVEIHGDFERQDGAAVYRRGGKAVALATLGRDRVSLAAEVALETGDLNALEALIARQ
ncbi:MAG TPA: FAD-dependent oxidoreductase [Candidatus Acidoferrales bacterium]|nr:FAD-dependent oxidoreductase [Candidatus Acidoferrales bacterium]